MVHSALESAKRQWEQTLDALPYPMVLVDLNCSVLRGNMAAAGGDVNRVKQLPGRSLNRQLREIQQQVVSRGSAGSVRLEGVRLLEPSRGHDWSDPVRECVDLFSTPLIDAEGQIQMVAHYLIDRSQELELERQLRQMQRLSEIGMLASGIAHNLNNPLQVLQGQLQLIEFKRQQGIEGIEPDELQRLSQQVERMTGIVTSLMMRLRDDQASSPVDVNVNELLRRDLKLLEADPFFKHQVQKVFHFDEDLPVVKCIPAELSQAIMNLVNNAMDAMREAEPRILRIRSRCTRNAAELEIEDTGCGIPDGLRERIFEPFFTTKAPLSERGKGRVTGTGLGLSSTLYLLERAGISLHLDSLPGKGTCFVLRWSEGESESEATESTPEQG
jgi:signal transduction histidine kinase